MKKILLSIGILACSIIGLSQKTDVQLLADTPLPVLITPANAPEEKLARLQAEVASLKAAHVEMKKQLSEIRSALPSGTQKKKLIVNRIGSKQTAWQKNDN